MGLVFNADLEQRLSCSSLVCSFEAPSETWVGPCRQRGVHQPGWVEVKGHPCCSNIHNVGALEKMLVPKVICLVPGTFPRCFSHSSARHLQGWYGRSIVSPGKHNFPAQLQLQPVLWLPAAGRDGWWASLVDLCLLPEPRMLHAGPPSPFPWLVLWASALYSCSMSLGIGCIKGQNDLKAAALVIQSFEWADFSFCKPKFF